MDFMVAHNGHVTKMTVEDLQGYLAARYQDHLASGRFADDDAVIAKVNEEAATFDGKDAFLAYCECGWHGNNPYPTRAGAKSSLTKHYQQTKDAA